ncbi:MAG TPA: TPM domain-containing protein [Flavobacteriales bacterium]|nr:TPM domain-containing protein [Flavobacteriales bacterium]
MRKLFLLLLIGAALPLSAARFPCDLKKPPEREQGKLLWSYAPLLNPAEEQRIDKRLTEFARETSNQVLVLIVDTLCGEEASDLAFAIGERWGIGQKDFDNGIVFLIKPTGGSGQRRVFIATGYGLEGAVPDAVCRRIVENEVLPRFKQGEFARGIEAALDVLFPLAQGEFSHADYGKQRAPWGPMAVMVVILIIWFIAWRSKVKSYAHVNRTDFWTAMWLLSQANRRGGGSWGGSGGGGFGGGGFGGFGGGSFGGGGAGGRW